MRTKRKISLTIDEDIYSAIESLAKNHKIPKSQLAQDAFRLWIKKEIETLMAKGYGEMYEEDQALAELTFTAQREVLK